MIGHQPFHLSCPKQGKALSIINVKHDLPFTFVPITLTRWLSRIALLVKELESSNAICTGQKTRRAKQSLMIELTGIIFRALLP